MQLLIPGTFLSLRINSRVGEINGAAIIHGQASSTKHLGVLTIPSTFSTRVLGAMDLGLTSALLEIPGLVIKLDNGNK